MEITRLVFKLLRGPSDFPLTTNIFLPVNVKLGWLEQRRGVYLIIFSSLLGRVWYNSSGTNLASHWQEAFADCTPTEEETYKAPSQKLLTLVNYTPLEISNGSQNISYLH
jgi:hypothetical protein